VTTNKSLAKKGMRIMKLIKLPATHLPSLLKTLLLTSTLTLSLMFSAGSWAEWTAVASSGGGSNTTYVDFDRIRKVNGLVYYWRVRDSLEPSSTGTMSTKLYSKVDCETMREMDLSFSWYKLPMAEGTAAGTFTPDPEWNYAEPDSLLEGTLQAVCAH